MLTQKHGRNSYFNIFVMMNKTEELKNYTAGIAGCGGLGSNCAIALARAGLGRLIICDHDRVEESNLNRQYYFRDQIGMYKCEALKQNIHRINPDICVVSYISTLTPDTIIRYYGDCDVIVEAFDLKEMKEMIVETTLQQLPHIPLVIGTGLAGWGKNNLLKTRKADNLYICGDETYEVSDDRPPLAPRVGIVACMQANVVLEILLGEME